MEKRTLPEIKKREVVSYSVNSTPSNNKDKMFIKIVVLLLVFLFIMCFFWFTILVSKGYFMSNINQSQDVQLEPIVNTSVINRYDFNPDTENTFENDFTFRFDIDEELIKRFCNSS